MTETMHIMMVSFLILSTFGTLYLTRGAKLIEEMNARCDEALQAKLKSNLSNYSLEANK